MPAAATVCSMSTVRRLPVLSMMSGTAVMVTVRTVFQLPVVKTRRAVPTVATVPSLLARFTVTAPVGSLSSTTV